MEDNRNQLFALILAAVAAAMGIAVFVLGVVDANVTPKNQVAMLAIGLMALGLRALINSAGTQPQNGDKDRSDDTEQ